MFKKALIIGAISSIASFSVTAEEAALSYTHAGIGYETGDIADIDFSGFGIYGSKALNESFFLTGSYLSIESDDQYTDGPVTDDIEATGFNFGVGFHTPINSTVDFVSTLSYSDVEVEFADESEDGNGYILAAGVRALPSDVLELSAFIDYADIEDSSETGYSLGARYFTTPDISLGLGYGSSDDFDAITFDVRFDM
ncbi:porin family protein [SAR92 clade bacterium H455]|uniref:Porin family protein n=1 Tax=SAR92 clade bacterium H455 TaxID=2974818 RepID=A0ABY5TLF7_9GAMM|nr:porin family protein [SAR92 clade bacterium H455]